MLANLRDHRFAREAFDADLDADTAADLARMCPTPTLPTCPSAEVLKLEEQLSMERRYVGLLRKQVTSLESERDGATARAEKAEQRLADIGRRVGMLREGRLWCPRVEGMVAAIALMLMGAATWLI